MAENPIAAEIVVEDTPDLNPGSQEDEVTDVNLTSAIVPTTSKGRPKRSQRLSQKASSALAGPIGKDEPSTSNICKTGPSKRGRKQIKVKRTKRPPTPESLELVSVDSDQSDEVAWEEASKKRRNRSRDRADDRDRNRPERSADLGLTPSQKHAISQMMAEREERARKGSVRKLRWSFRSSDSESDEPGTSGTKLPCLKRSRGRSPSRSPSPGSYLTDSSMVPDETDSGEEPSGSDDSDGRNRKSKKDRAKKTPQPTGYWLGKGKDPTKAGKIAGSREKLSDRRSKAREKNAQIERVCRGVVPTARYATSHLLMGFQLREARRIWRQLGSCHGGRDRKRRDPLYDHLGVAIQIGIDGARHEVEMARVHDTLGAEVVEGVEGSSGSDRRYVGRTEYVVKQLKKIKVDDALLRTKPANMGSRPFSATKFPSSGKKWNYRGTRAGKKVETFKKPTGIAPRCFLCASPLHLAKDCPKRKDVKRE